MRKFNKAIILVTLFLVLQSFLIPTEVLAKGGLSFIEIEPINKVVGRYQKFEIDLKLSRKFDNPYDPDEIMLEAEFISPSGKKSTVAGFYYQPYERSLKHGTVQTLKPIGEGFFKVRFTPTETGNWRYRVMAASGKGEGSSSGWLNFKVKPSSEKGFIRAGSKYFNYDNGELFFPIGENVCWYSSGRKTYDYDDWMEKLALNKCNFMRLWMAPWAMAVEWKETGLGRYNQKTSWELDHVFERSEELGIKNILSLIDHGQFSEKHDARWQENPYNQFCGGPSERPNGFLTQPDCKNYFKRRLRYIVARWGYSTSLMAWEWFNEVDLSELSLEDLDSWLDEMTTDLRAMDVNQHPISTSFHRCWTDCDVWQMNNLDFIQEHIYNRRDFPENFKLAPQLANERFNKPFLVGEFGWSDEDFRVLDKEGIHLHESIWSASLSGAAGTPLIWYWDEYIDPNNLYYHYRILAEFLENEYLPGLDILEVSPENAREDIFIAALGSDNNVLGWIKNQSANLDEFVVYYLEKKKNEIRRERGIPEKNVIYPPRKITDLKISVPVGQSGYFEINWYNCYNGNLKKQEHIKTNCKMLVLDVPQFAQDIAFKVKRVPWWMRLFAYYYKEK